MRRIQFSNMEITFEEIELHKEFLVDDKFDENN